MTQSRPMIEAAGERAAYIEAKGDLHGRAIPEWLGPTPDTPCPEHVQLRILLRQSRRCAITGRPIRPGDKTHADHIISLKQGGENRESNIQIVLVEPHQEKTAKENTENAKVERLQLAHYGMKPKPRRKLQSRGFEKRKWA